MKIYNKPGSKERLLEMMKGVTKEDKVKINENIEKKEDSQPYGGSKQKYQDGMGYGDEKPVNPKLRVKAPELEKFVKEEGEQSGYDLPVGDDTIVIKINGYPWYLRKAGDSTHFYMSNNAQALNTGAAWASHIGEHRNKPYYNDIRAWLKGGESPTGKEYDDPMTMDERSGAPEPEGLEGEDLLRSKYTNLDSDMEFKKMAQAYENLLKLQRNKHRAKYVTQNALSSLRDMITDYLNAEKNIPVSGEDVQNFFTNWSEKYSSVMSENDEEKEFWVGDDELPAGQTKEPPQILQTQPRYSGMDSEYSKDNYGGYYEGEEKKEIEDAELDPTDADNDGDFVPGGLADDADIEQFDPQQISMGIEVEMEHTNDPKVALEITMDHLMELPDYYTRLKAMEDKGEEELDGDNGMSDMDGGEEELDGDNGMPGVDSDEEGNPIPATDPNFSDMGMDNEETPEEFADDREEMEDEFSQYFDDLKSADEELKNNLVGFDNKTPNASEEDSKYGL